MSVLDIYCGPGEVARMAADRVGPSGRVIGIDPSSDAIACAESRSAAHGYTNIEYRCADLDNPALAASLFDVVICRHVVIGQRQPVGFLRSASHLVRSGGVEPLHTAFETLTAPQRAAIFYADICQRPYKTIAEVTGAPVGRVISRLDRGRRRLRIALRHLESKSA